MTAIQFANISKSFDDKVVLSGLSFSVERGEVYGLLGPNGSGKSTAINILCNLLDADSGKVEISGEAVSPASRGVIGICPQEVALYRDLTPSENFRFFADMYGLSRSDGKARSEELLHLFALDPFATLPVSTLSGGWQRRVNIAVALVQRPDILILDEPTAALDVEARHDLWIMIEALKNQGMTLLLTTHHLDEAERLCTRIGVMADGRIVKEGTVAELLALVPAKSIVMVESRDTGALRARAEQLGWSHRTYAGRFACLLRDPLPLAEIVRALEGIEATSISVSPVSLEHAYVEILHPEGALADREIPANSAGVDLSPRIATNAAAAS